MPLQLGFVCNGNTKISVMEHERGKASGIEMSLYELLKLEGKLAKIDHTSIITSFH